MMTVGADLSRPQGWGGGQIIVIVYIATTPGHDKSAPTHAWLPATNLYTRSDAGGASAPTPPHPQKPAN
jgi:hypothetical protein